MINNDNWEKIFKYETKLNKPTLEYIIDSFFPIPEEENMKFSDCFFGESSKDFFDSEDYYFW